MSDVSSVMTLDEYQKARKTIFPSGASIRWDVFENRDVLVRAGALLRLKGRWYADPAKYDAVIYERGLQAAQRSLETWPGPCRRSTVAA